MKAAAPSRLRLGLPHGSMQPASQVKPTVVACPSESNSAVFVAASKPMLRLKANARSKTE